MTLPADAREPLLHEFVPSSDSEDVSMAVTTPSGDLPAALDTKSGVIRAPDTRAPHRQPSKRTPSRWCRARLPPTTPIATPEGRRWCAIKSLLPIDRSLQAPSRLRLGGRRLRAQSARHVVGRSPHRGGASPRRRRLLRRYRGRFRVDLVGLDPVGGARARILRQHATPNIPIDVWRDGADNWYAHTTAPRPGRVRLVMEVAIAREAMGGSSTCRGGRIWRIPPRSQRGAGPRSRSRKWRRQSGSREPVPAENTKKLVAYFRSFAPSDNPPRATGDVYLDLALSKKGVCRHRAFAFLVTALGMGIPARMVLNEAHAWVEVLGRRWQRI